MWTKARSGRSCDQNEQKLVRYSLGLWLPSRSREAIEKQMENMKLSTDVREKMLGKLQDEEYKRTQAIKKKIKLDDFDMIAIIGRGAFGEVRVVRKHDTQQVFAMKIMKKTEMLKKNQVAHIRAERSVLLLYHLTTVILSTFSAVMFWLWRTTPGW